MILDSNGHVLPGCLPASFRGVSFFVPDTSTEPGRRVAEALFPGLDRAAYDDFGLSPAVITVDGFMVGDDYIIQARALEAAFERPGPGTLIHPWLGGMTVILEEPGTISFSASELRVARFSASFKRVSSGLLALGGTAATLLSAASAFLLAVRAFGTAPAAGSISRTSSLAAGRTGRIVTATWSDVATGL
uniref:DNA circularization N-terminal domain-containing protein n=1 Tax=Mesorhizobium sp. 1M-11 TaxID=1529006 RepID=UPI000A46C0B7